MQSFQLEYDADRLIVKRIIPFTEATESPPVASDDKNKENEGDNDSESPPVASDDENKENEGDDDSM